MDAISVLQSTAFMLGFPLALITTYLAVPRFADWFKRRGIVGVDVHKLDKPKIPEMCGVAIILGVGIASLLMLGLFTSHWREIAAFSATVTIAGMIGVIDDLKPLGPKLKPVLTALAAAPILLLGAYYPHPMIPFIGEARLTIIYPILIPISIAVTSNASNMLDVFNGAMSGALAIASCAVGAVLVLAGNPVAAGLALALAASLITFYVFNRYPARVFCGDAGSLAVGAALGSLAIIGHVEVFVIIALAPCIMNAFYGLASVGRLYERREIRSRPTRLRADGLLEATADRSAPVTLTRLILAAGPLHEKQVARTIMFLSLVSSVLAVLAFLIIGGT